MTLRIYLVFFLLFQGVLFAQDADYSTVAIPKELTENADAIIRLDKKEVTIASVKSMTIKTTRVVTVLNESGMGAVEAEEYFDKSDVVKSIEALVYDQHGTQIKKIKRKDFKEASISQGYSVSDTRILYMDYTPVQYPFTVVFTSESETENTAFIPQWSAVEGAYVSTEKAEISITCKPGLGFKSKEYNFEGSGIKKEQTETTLTYKAENIPASKKEDYSPSYRVTAPYVLFALNKFHLEGIDGEASDWKSFGKWRYESLLVGTDELPVATVEKIKSLTGNETDPLKKAKIVYEYVQSKTRYVSIQLGIGGWKPMPAKDVDRLGYGDCKALTNYTKALLKAVGVESYYTVVYGDTNKRDILEDFVCMQGNHIILAIPNGDKYVWLECTSQTAPFGFQGDFTDDRLALLVKPEGGEIIRTTIYDATGNTQISKGSYEISETGGIAAHIIIASKGLQYDGISYLESRSADERDKYYKSHLSTLNNMKLKKADLKNKKDSQEFIEDLTIESEGYCSKSGNRMMFAINAFNVYSKMPQRYRNRKNPFEISTGFYDTDEVTIALPAGFTLEAMPDNVVITDKFGEYKAEYSSPEPGKMFFKRSLLLNAGQYQSSEYENFRQFIEKIARNDNAKAVLVKS